MLAAVLALPLEAVASPLAPNAVIRVSVAGDGGQANGTSLATSLSGDGSLVAFRSRATNLVPGDTNSSDDVFLRNLATGTIGRVTVAWDGGQANGPSDHPAVSADGTTVAFDSSASNLVPGDSNGYDDVFVRRLASGTTTRVSVAWDGGPANFPSRVPALSADGTRVAFASAASNLVPGDTNGREDIFVRDLKAGITTRVSVATDGSEADHASYTPAISADGTTVAFASPATNLVPGDTNGNGDDGVGYDVFVRDLASGVTKRVSVATGGAQANHNSSNPSLSADGMRVAFDSGADNLVRDDNNVSDDVFVHERMTGVTTAVSLTNGDALALGQSYGPSISADGRRVAFVSYARLAPNDLNRRFDVFVRDVPSGTTTLASAAGDGTNGNDHSTETRMSADGSTVAFQSESNNLVPGDTNGATDVFARGFVPAEERELDLPYAIWGYAEPQPLQGTGGYIYPVNVPAAGPGQLTPNYLYSEVFVFADLQTPGSISLGIDGDGRFAEFVLGRPNGSASVQRISYPWQPGTPYFALAYHLGGAQWGAWIVDSAGTPTLVGVLQGTSDQTALFPATITTVQWRGDLPVDCKAFPLAQVFFFAPYGYPGSAPVATKPIASGTNGGTCSALSADAETWIAHSVGSP